MKTGDVSIEKKKEETRRDLHLTPGLEIGRSRGRHARSQVSDSASIYIPRNV